jgi:hypothetical protein
MFQNFGATFGYANFGDPIMRRGFNRTNAAIKAGQVAMLDISKTQTETTTLDGASSSIQANLGPVTQALLALGYPIWVAAEDMADNAEGQWIVYGYCDVAINDDDCGTTDIDIGEPVTCLVSEAVTSTGSPAALTTGGGSCQAVAAVTDRSLGIACEDAAASSSNTDRTIDAGSHRRRVLWCGGLYTGHRQSA